MKIKVDASVAPDGTVTVDIEAGDRSATVQFTDHGVEFSVPEETS